MSLSPDILAQILNLVAARQESTPIAPQVVPVTSEPFELDYIVACKAEQPILCSRNQDVASDIFTSAQEEQEVCMEISNENAATNADIIEKRGDTVTITSLPIHKAPHIDIMSPDNTNIRSRPLCSYIKSAPFTPRPSRSLAFASFDSSFVFNHSSLPL